MSYFYGSLYGSGYRIHYLRMLAVDYNGDAIGKSVCDIYSMLADPTFVTLEYQNLYRINNASSLAREMYFRGYWGIIYTLTTEGQDRIAHVLGLRHMDEVRVSWCTSPSTPTSTHSK